MINVAAVIKMAMALIKVLTAHPEEALCKAEAISADQSYIGCSIDVADGESFSLAIIHHYVPGSI